MDARIAHRFWQKVAVGGKEECWPWMAGKFRDGYGMFGWAAGDNRRAHRVALQLTGTDVSGKLVCHRCDNRLCCNPSHLFTGTPADNSADCVAKGRQPAREKNGRAKLDTVSANAIRTANSVGVTQAELSRWFGVSKSTVWYVCNGQHWGSP